RHQEVRQGLRAAGRRRSGSRPAGARLQPAGHPGPAARHLAGGGSPLRMVPGGAGRPDRARQRLPACAPAGLRPRRQPAVGPDRHPARLPRAGRPGRSGPLPRQGVPRARPGPGAGLLLRARALAPGARVGGAGAPRSAHHDAGAVLRQLLVLHRAAAVAVLGIPVVALVAAVVLVALVAVAALAVAALAVAALIVAILHLAGGLVAVAPLRRGRG